MCICICAKQTFAILHFLEIFSPPVGVTLSRFTKQPCLKYKCCMIILFVIRNLHYIHPWGGGGRASLTITSYLHSVAHAPSPNNAASRWRWRKFKKLHKAGRRHEEPGLPPNTEEIEILQFGEETGEIHDYKWVVTIGRYKRKHTKSQNEWKK